jgi:hypothetical protein
MTIQRPARRQRLSDEANKWAFRRRFRGKIFEVVLYWFHEENTLIVKTAYFMSKSLGFGSRHREF